MSGTIAGQVVLATIVPALWLEAVDGAAALLVLSAAAAAELRTKHLDGAIPVWAIIKTTPYGQECAKQDQLNRPSHVSCVAP